MPYVCDLDCNLARNDSQISEKKPVSCSFLGRKNLPLKKNHICGTLQTDEAVPENLILFLSLIEHRSMLFAYESIYRSCCSHMYSIQRVKVYAVHICICLQSQSLCCSHMYSFTKLKSTLFAFVFIYRVQVYAVCICIHLQSQGLCCLHTVYIHLQSPGPVCL